MGIANRHPSARYHFKFVLRAATELATGPGDVRHRLVYAGSYFVLVPLEVVPEHLRPQAEKIRLYLTEFKADSPSSFPDHPDIRATLKRRRPSTAVRAARWIWDFYHEYRDAMECSFGEELDSVVGEPIEMAIMQLRLERTYRRQGFFNVFVDFDRFVSMAEGAIEIHAEGFPRPIKGRINRKANRNGTARIHGGRALATYFQQFDQGHWFDVHFLSSSEIRIASSIANRPRR